MIPDPLVQQGSDSFPWRRRAETGRENRPYLQVMKVISEERALTNPSVSPRVYKPYSLDASTKPVNVHPKDMTRLWEQIEMEVPAKVGALPEDGSALVAGSMVTKNG